MKYVALSALLMVPVMALGDSTCYGTTSSGRLEDSCKLPSSGANFSSYSHILRLAGRTYVHCRVQQVLLSAYESLQASAPDSVYVYGETGKRQGGAFPPHKTHQNGLSVDFMIPVMNSNGRSVPLPTHILNKYGYDIDFTLDGNYEDLRIDYESFAAHLVALQAAAKSAGVGIWRVLFDPKMQGALRDTDVWSQISSLNFSKKRSWVRHDDHYHVDFEIPCEPL